MMIARPPKNPFDGMIPLPSPGDDGDIPPSWGDSWADQVPEIESPWLMTADAEGDGAETMNLTAPLLGRDAEIMPEYWHGDPDPGLPEMDLSQYESFNVGAGLEIDPGSHQAIGGPAGGPHILPAYPGGNKPDLPANARTLNRHVFAKSHTIRTENEMWMHLIGYIPVFVHLFTTRQSDYEKPKAEPRKPRIHVGDGEVVEGYGAEYVDGETKAYDKKGQEGVDYQKGEQKKYEAQARSIKRNFAIDVALTLAGVEPELVLGRLIMKGLGKLAVKYLGLETRAIVRYLKGARKGKIRYHVDFTGKSHYNKSTGEEIATPHTRKYDLHEGDTGYSYTYSHHKTRWEEFIRAVIEAFRRKR